MSHPYSILLLSIAIINLTLGFYALRFYKSPGALAYTFIMAFLGLYSLGYAFELQALNLEQILFWLKIEYFGISFLPPLFVIMAAQYTGMGRLLKPWLIVPMFLLSFFTLTTEYTNFGNLFYREIKLSTEVDFVLAAFTAGPWYWVHQAYANLMLMLSCLLYFLMFRRTAGQSRKRAIIMLLALGIPWCFYLIYLIGGSPYNIDLSPFSFSIAGILTAFGIYRYRLLENVPMALEHVFSSMTVGVVILDEDRCLISFNPAASEILPELAAWRVGKPVDPVFEVLPCLAVLTDGFTSDIEFSHLGHTRYYHLQVVAAKTERGRVTGWVITFTDITERKLKEFDLLAAEKRLKQLNVSKDKFFALIAHDLRNAFHLIINMSEMITENLHNDDKTASLRKAKIIYDTSVTTYSLLQNLLDWALMQLKGLPFKPAELVLRSLVDEEIKNLKTISDQKELTIHCSIDSSLTIKGDKEMLKTVFRNLISNAIKYSFSRGIISIDAFVKNGKTTIEVRDNGVGMTPEDLDKLFQIESYFSRKGTSAENGTGLGLRLCKEFIRTHGGDIWVNSTLGKGSTFGFSIPVKQSMVNSDSEQ